MNDGHYVVYSECCDKVDMTLIVKLMMLLLTNDCYYMVLDIGWFICGYE